MNAGRRAPYVQDVGRYFGDLRWRQRREILDDLDQHLRDAGVDPEVTAAWTNRFGDPVDYARQLRADAGLAVDERGLAAARQRHLRSIRPRLLALVGIVVFLAVGALGGVVASAHYQPLRFGNVVSSGGAKLLQAGGSDEYQYTFERGSGFAVGTWLYNHGSFSVHVTTIALQSVDIPWSNWRVELGRDNDPGGTPPVTTPLTSFDIAPGHGRLVWFRGDFRTCPTNEYAGGSVGISTVDVGYRALGLQHHKTLQLGFTYSVLLAAACK